MSLRDAFGEGDNVVLPRKKKGADAEMDITPMIDITFLLLIFFLVAARLEEPANLSLPEAKTGTAVGNKNSVVLIVRQGAGDDVNVEGGNGKQFTSGDLDRQEDEIKQYVLDNMDATKTEVLIRAEKAVKHREVSRIAKAAAKASDEGNRLFIAVKEI